MSRETENKNYNILQKKRYRNNSIFPSFTSEQNEIEKKERNTYEQEKSNNTIWLPLDTDDLLYYIETRKFNCSLSDRGNYV